MRKNQGKTTFFGFFPSFLRGNAFRIRTCFAHSGQILLCSASTALGLYSLKLLPTVDAQERVESNSLVVQPSGANSIAHQPQAEADLRSCLEPWALQRSWTARMRLHALRVSTSEGSPVVERASLLEGPLQVRDRSHIRWDYNLSRADHTSRSVAGLSGTDAYLASSSFALKVATDRAPELAWLSFFAATDARESFDVWRRRADVFEVTPVPPTGSISRVIVRCSPDLPLRILIRDAAGLWRRVEIERPTLRRSERGDDALFALPRGTDWLNL